MRNKTSVMTVLSVFSIFVVMSGCKSSSPKEERQKQPDIPQWALDLTEKLNDISNWAVAVGDWNATPQGRIRGVGNSRIAFKHDVPSEYVLSFRMKVIEGMRPRVFLASDDSIRIGDESMPRHDKRFEKILSAYGPGLDHVWGKYAYYVNGQELFVEIHYRADRIKCFIENSLAAEGLRSTVKRNVLGLSAGDTSSEGTVEFWDFRIRPIDAVDTGAAGELSWTSIVGGQGGHIFADLPEGQAFLAGFIEISGSDVINSLQPVFRFADGDDLGNVHGQPRGKRMEVVAKPGYAVGGLIVKGGGLVDGFKIVFMQIKDGALNPNDTYESQWIGGRGGGPETRLAGDGKPVIGIHGREGLAMDSIGLVQVKSIDRLNAKPEVGTVEALVRQLQLGTPNSRIRAAASLGELGDKRAVEPLIATLKSTQEHMRTAVAESLGKLGDKRAVEPLIAALEYSGNKDSIIAALSKLGDPRAVRLLVQYKSNYMGYSKKIRAIGPVAKPALIELLRDKDEKIRETAADFLGELSWAPEKGLDQAYYFVMGRKWHELDGLGSVIVEPLLLVLQDPQSSNRSQAIRALGESGDVQAIGPLVAILKEDDWQIGNAALAALNKLGWQPDQACDKAYCFVMNRQWQQAAELGTVAIKPLVIALRESYSSPTEDLIQALAVLGRDAVDPLVELLEMKNREKARRGAAKALGLLGETRAVDPLIAALKDRESWVRQEVVMALGKLGDRRAVIPLISTLKDKDWCVRSEAATALGELGDQRSVEPLIEAMKDQDETVRIAVVRSLAKFGGQRTSDSLLLVLNDPDGQTRAEAAKAIGKLGEKRAGPLLIEMLRDENDDARAAAAMALGDLCEKTALERLITRLNDSSYGVQDQSIIALGKLGDKRAVEPLLKKAANAQYENTRSLAMKALEGIKIAAVPALVQSLQDKDFQVRRTSAQALDTLEWKPANKVEQAYYLVAKWKFSKAVDKTGEASLEPLLLALEDKDSRVRREAAMALGSLGDKRAVEPLIKALGDKYDTVRSMAVSSLGQLKDRRAVGPLTTALQDKLDHIRRDAYRALAQLECPVFETAVTVLNNKGNPGRETAAKMLGETGDRRAVEPLITALKDDDSEVRRAVIKALVSLGDERAVEPLIVGLQDEASTVRSLAAKALGLLQDKRAVGSLITVLQDQDGPVRLAAAEALGSLRDKRAVGPLIKTLKDRDPKVQASAASALGYLGDERAIPALMETLRDNEDFVVDRSIQFALEVIGSASVSPLIEALQSESGNVRRKAVCTLGMLGHKQAVGPLIKALKDDDESVRRVAATALGKLGDKEAVGSLISTLEDKSSSVRHEAVEALGTLGDTRAVEPLIRTLNDDNSWVQSTAIVSLAKFKDPKAVAAIIGALDNEDDGTREQAAETLGELKNQLAVRPLIGALKDKDNDVREKAAAALAELGDAQAVEPLIELVKTAEDDGLRAQAIEALGKLGDKRAVEPLITVALDKSPWVRSRAITVLGDLGDTRAVEPLIIILNDTEDSRRPLAAESLGKLGDKRAAEPLIAGLEDDDSSLRAAAVKALGQLGDARAVKGLVTALEQEYDIRSQASRALIKIGIPSVGPLIEALKNEDKSVRAQAAFILGRLGDKRAAEPLVVSLAETDEWIVKQAALALGALDDRRAAPALLVVLKKDTRQSRIETAAILHRWGYEEGTIALQAELQAENWVQREMAARSLLDPGDRYLVDERFFVDIDLTNFTNVSGFTERTMRSHGWGAPDFDFLLQKLKDEDHCWRAWAAWTLGHTASEQAVDPLIAALRDTNWWVRKEAAEALGRLSDKRAIAPLKTLLEDEKVIVRETAGKSLSNLKKTE